MSLQLPFRNKLLKIIWRIKIKSLQRLSTLEAGNRPANMGQCYLLLSLRPVSRIRNPHAQIDFGH